MPTADLVMQYLIMFCANRARELCESPGLPVPNSPYGLCGRKAKSNIISEFRSCVKVEVDISNSPYGLCGRKATSEFRSCVKVEVDVSNSPYGLCGRKAKSNIISEFRSCVKVLGSPSLIVRTVFVDVKQY